MPRYNVGIVQGLFRVKCLEPRAQRILGDNAQGSSLDVLGIEN